MNDKGQALMETAFFFSLVAILLGGLVTFTQWFLIHQKLLAVTRLAAMMYSSGRFTKPEIARSVKASLERGAPILEPQRVRLVCRPTPGWMGTLLRFDEVRVSYEPKARLLTYFTKTMEEQCTIKHSPRYLLLDRVPR